MTINSIFFTDDRVQNEEVLFSDKDVSSSEGVLDSSLDGNSRFRGILSAYHDLESVQIIAHGTTGAVNIGSAVLNSVTLPDFLTQIEAIGSSLNVAEDLLLYEGDIASGDTEQIFINDLARITVTDVAASDDLLGSTSLDGHWSDDIKVGDADEIDSRISSPLLAAIDGAIGDDKVAGRSDNDSLYGLDGIEFTTVSAEKDLVSDQASKVTDYAHITTKIDTSVNAYSWTNCYDVIWSPIESAYSDIAGNNSITRYLTRTDADGIVAGYSNITTTVYADGNSNILTNHYDANWVLSESTYSDSAGNSSATQYLTRTDADGKVTGHTVITTGIDSSGNSYSSTNHYDAKWTVTESAFTDIAGNTSVTQYQTNTDADGNVVGYTLTSTTIYADGYASNWTNHYDAKWTVTESAFTDSSGNKSVTQYQTSTDADGNVTGYTPITTSTDSSGNSYSSTDNYDTKWTLTESGFTYISGNTSNCIDANNDGIIGALASIELNVFKVTREETVPVICVCWLEEDLYKADAPYYDADGSATAAAVMEIEIEFVGTAAPTAPDFLIVS